MSPLADRDANDIARGAGANFIGFVIRFGARFPFIFIAGLLYGPVLFGQFTFIVAAIETAAAFAMFGFRRSLFIFINEPLQNDDRRAFSSVVANALALAMALSFGLAGAFAFVGAHYIQPSAVETPLYLFAFVIPAIAAGNILLAATRATRRMRYEVWTRSVIEPLTLTLSALGCYYLGARESGLLLAFTLSHIAALGAALFYFSRVFSLRLLMRAKIDRSTIADMVRLSGPTAVMDLLNILLLRVDIFLLSYFTSDAAVGIYGMAQQFATSVKKLRQSFDPILGPVISQIILKDSMARAASYLAMVARWIMASQLVLVIALGFFGALLLDLAGPSFASGAMVLTVLVIGDMINGSFSLAELPILYQRPRVNPVVAAVMLGFHVLLCTVMVNRFGPIGAAGSVAVTYSLKNVTLFVLNKKFFDVYVFNLTLLKPLLAGIASIGVLVALDYWIPTETWLGFAVGLPVLLVSYAAILLALGLEEQDRTQLRRAFGRA